MCMSCVAQGGPYVIGSLVALQAMAASSRRRRRDEPAGSFVAPEFLAGASAEDRRP
jgi:uncharacterized protein (TIGR03382 family)